jgi:hypothetical protein
VPLYVNGSAAKDIVEVVDVSEKIASAIRENNGRLGDLSKYTESEMKFVIIAMREIAKKSVLRLAGNYEWMNGVDIGRVVDNYEVFPHHGDGSCVG